MDELTQLRLERDLAKANAADLQRQLDALRARIREEDKGDELATKERPDRFEQE